MHAHLRHVNTYMKFEVQLNFLSRDTAIQKSQKFIFFEKLFSEKTFFQKAVEAKIFGFRANYFRNGGFIPRINYHESFSEIREPSPQRFGSLASCTEKHVFV